MPIRKNDLLLPLNKSCKNYTGMCRNFFYITKLLSLPIPFFAISSKQEHFFLKCCVSLNKCTLFNTLLHRYWIGLRKLTENIMVKFVLVLKPFHVIFLRAVSAVVSAYTTQAYIVHRELVSKYKRSQCGC